MLGVVVVTYNSEGFIETCLTSLLADTKDLEAFVVMVDNASADRSVDIVQRRFPVVHVLQNQENKGFSKAVNQGIQLCLKQACQEVLLLNPDTKVEQGAISEMRRVLSEDSKRGVVQPLLTLMRDPELINTWGNEYRGFGLVTVGGYRRRVRSSQFAVRSGESNEKRKTNNYELPTAGCQLIDRKIDYASGACMLIRSEVFDRVGLFDEEYFLYFEDTEFSQRVRQAGFEIFLVADARVQHHYSFPISFQKIRHFLAGWWRFGRQRV